MRYIFWGTPEFASVTLQHLIKKGQAPIAVVTNPDKPQGRKRKIKPSPVKETAIQNNLPILQPEKLKNPDFFQQLEEYSAELFVVVAFRILPPQILRIPQMGSINLHASLLPDYRGAAPINYVLLNNERKTGVTTFFLNEKVDSGKILLQKEVEIKDDYNAGILHDILLDEGKRILSETISGLENQTLQAFEQPRQTIHYAPKITHEDLLINWQETAEHIHNRIRAFSPYPAAYSVYMGQKIKFYGSKIIRQNSHQPPGTILKANQKDGLIVQASDFQISITELQLQGKKKMDVNSFLRGNNFREGAIIT